MIAISCLSGAAGTASAGAPGYHPEPRVIVDVVNVVGPHDRGELEREARRSLWGKIIACYRPAAMKKPGLHGEATLRFRVGAEGKVFAPRAEQSTLGDEAVVACFGGHVARLSMPKARSASEVQMQIHVAPGDPPGP